MMEINEYNLSGDNDQPDLPPKEEPTIPDKESPWKKPQESPTKPNKDTPWKKPDPNESPNTPEHNPDPVKPKDSK